MILLAAGLALILLTGAAAVIGMIGDYHSEGMDPLDRKMILPTYFLFFFPILLEQASLLRSVYKSVKWAPKGAARVCWILSAALAACGLIFQGLILTGVVSQRIFPEGPRAASSRFAEMQIIVGWTAGAVSFILGSVKRPKG